MPIVALPQTTVRAIGSTSVISDPCSVVKELLDNALDASASSVQVEISQNTVDVIQLKDNGHGIPPEDHPNACKHAFTSKIETVDDLRNVGGASLGFRGEALASVAEMSGGVTITTRVASEVTATCLKYGRDGQLISSSRVSHPAGTTVRITDFLKHVPVRRQTTLKGAGKILAKLKRLLQAYAFAQPSKRLSLKVTKGKSESNNWLYTPSAEATLTDAALKIAGRNVASSCAMKVGSSGPPGSGDGSEQSRYEMVALLPKLDSDITRVSNVGQYLSVDGRPLTTHTGIGQEITKLFKTYVRTAASSVETSTKITDPFCCLQLKCPRAAYDVNIEPGKDDVLFGDRDLVISLVEKLLSEHYGALEHSHKSSPAKAKTLSHNNPSGSSEFQLLLARRRPEQPPLQVQKDGHGSPNTTLSSPASERTTPPSSSQSPRSPRGAATEKNAGNDNTASESRGSRHLNPWSISRINASFHTPEKPRATLSNSHSPEETSPRVARQQNRQLRSARQSSQGSPELPSPPNSSVARCSPMSTQQTPRGALSEPRNSANSRRAARERDRALYGNGALDTWFQRITGGGPSQSPPASTPAQDENTPSLSQLARERFLRDQPRSRVAGASTDLEVPETPSNSYSPGDGDAQPSPQGGPDTASGYSGGPEGSMDSGRGFPVLERWAASPHKDLDSGSPTDLERALDFERRKKEANQRHRTHSGARDGQSNPATDLSPTPHHNRYLAAKASLTAEKPQNETSPGPALSPHDPRAYLMRHQNDHQSNKSSSTVGTVQRLHTSKLPFERIPDGHNLHDSCLPLPADLSLISSTFQLTTLHDSFTRYGTETDAFAASDMDATVSFWSQRVAAIIKKQYKTQDQSRSPERQVDLAPVMARHHDTPQFNSSQAK